MIILAIDTTMNGCSACVYDAGQGRSLAQQSLEMSRGQAEQLIPIINQTLQDAALSYDDIDLIAVTKGPGAFTGMRVGLATAKSLGLALNIPVHGICTFRTILETYLYDSSHKKFAYYGVLLETKRQDYYFQLFSGKIGAAISDKAAINAADILTLIDATDCILLGDAFKRFEGDVSSAGAYEYHDINMPNAAAIARLAVGGHADYDCAPVYLRAPEIGTPKNLPRKIKVTI